MTKDSDFDWAGLDEVQFSRDVLMVYQYLNKPRIPKSKGSDSIQALHAWAIEEGGKNKTEFLKNLVPKAQEVVRKAKLGQSTEAEVLHERKGIAKLQVILQEELAKCASN